MSPPTKGDVLIIPAYSAESEKATLEIQWFQSLRTRTACYYVVPAQNQSKNNEIELIYVQDRFYGDEGSNDHIGKIPGTRREGNSWVVSISGRFQYGQKNKNGEDRWVALHDKDNKPCQHRFMISTIQGQAAEWAKVLAR